MDSGHQFLGRESIFVNNSPRDHDNKTITRRAPPVCPEDRGTKTLTRAFSLSLLSKSPCVPMYMHEYGECIFSKAVK
jgi:hypothetical protein